MMIKAEELRIGNLVNVPRADQIPFRIDAFEFLGKDFGKVAQNNGTYMVMDIEVPFHPLTWELKDLSPIPLTPKILEKFGLNFDGLTYRNKTDLVVSGEFTWVGIYIPRNDEDVTLDCPEYVHQLQNLYYALTGTELTITL